MHNLICMTCGIHFTRRNGDYNEYTRSGHYCSINCFNQYQRRSTPNLTCKQCGNNFTRMQSALTRSKTQHFFCNHSCAAKYNNTHKVKGCRRSKLELFLERNITGAFPTLTLLPNDKTAINSELDFYFPELRLAIEINGILHYKPVYGLNKYNQIANNDKQKAINCRDKGIELIVIPTIDTCLTQQRLESYWIKVSDIITMRKNRKEAEVTGLEPV